jgi:membrane AbrB-like protein
MSGPRASSRTKAVVVLSGVLVGLTLSAVGVPGGAFIGALLGAAVAGIRLDADLRVPTWFKTSMRAVIGTALGVALAAIPAAQLIRWAGAGVIYVVGVIGLSAAVGALYALRQGIPVMSGLVATAPGGMSEMALIAEEHGLDVEVVVTLQFLRKILAILVVVPILTFFPL